MAAKSYRPFAVFPALATLLCLSDLTVGLHTPLNVKAEGVHVNGTIFLIISWDSQAEANYSMIHVRNYFNKPGIKGHSTTTVPPVAPFCNDSRCSYCFFDVDHRQLSCQAFNPGYTFSIGIELGFEKLISYKVGACRTNETSSCLDSMWQNYTMPPGAPSAVRNVHARPLSSKSVEVTWKKPNQTRGTIQDYTVYYKAGHGQEQHKVFPTDLNKDTKGTISRLQPNTTYSIWMIASTSKRRGESSDVTTVTTFENECDSNPCHHNSQCKLTGDSYECVCLEGWEGKNCHDPKEYTFQSNVCLDVNLYISLEGNLTLVSCFKKCNEDSSCKSFGYGRGYSKEGSFQSDLYIKDVGRCKRWSAGADVYKLTSCPYNYYEKKETPKGSSADVAPVIILLTLSVVMSAAMIY